jgi:hypothetical protein
MPKRQPLPIFRLFCVIGITLLLLGYICSLVELPGTITNVLYLAGVSLLTIGAVGWLITGFGI